MNIDICARLVAVQDYEIWCGNGNFFDMMFAGGDCSLAEFDQYIDYMINAIYFDNDYVI